MFDIFALSSSTDLTFWEKLAEWYQGSLLHELLTYFQERYFTVEFGAYENFSISAQTAATVRMMIPALAIALVVATLFVAHLRVNLGRFVRRLLKNESFSPEKAQSLHELGLFRNAALRRELTRGTTLRMVARCLHDDGRATGVGVYLDHSAAELDALIFDKEKAAQKAAKATVKQAGDADGKGNTAPDSHEAAALDNTSAQDQTATAEMGSTPATHADSVPDGTAKTAAAELATEAGSAGENTADSEPDVTTDDANYATRMQNNAHTVRKNAFKRRPSIDFVTARFYIPKELKYRADVRFDRRGSGWGPAIATVVIVVIFAALLSRFLPAVLGLADAIISLASPN